MKLNYRFAHMSCGFYPYTCWFKVNGSNQGTHTISSFPGNYTNYTIDYDFKVGDRIQLVSNRNVSCIGGTGLRDELWVGKTNIQWKPTSAGKYPFGDNYNGVNPTDITIVGFANKSGTPTYLETLDKLDQWSSAQYIPESRNKLNL